MKENIKLECASFHDEDTGMYWFEVGSMHDNIWCPIEISGVLYPSRLSADKAAARELPQVIRAVNRHIVRLEERRAA